MLMEMWSLLTSIAEPLLTAIFNVAVLWLVVKQIDYDKLNGKDVDKL